MAAATTTQQERQTRPKRLGWLVTLAALVVAGVGFWYAHAHGWLNPAYAWVHGLMHRGPSEKSGQGGMANMPGMDMGSMPMGRKGKHSQVPGHTDVTLPFEVQQRIGVTVGAVEEAPLRMSVRTVGIIQPDETRIARVHLKTEGWVQKLFVDYTGQKVKKGDPLLAIYSPQFLTTQQEFLDARQAKRESVAALARQRLELWDVPADEMEELARSGKPHTYLTLRSPLNGTVLLKNAFAGQYVTPQTDLYTVADLSTIWVQAKVYEYELPHVGIGQPATVTVQAVPGQEFKGKVVFVQPAVDSKTRTIQVRVELPNPDDVLKPGMFTQVVIQHQMGTGLLIPASALIRTGVRDIAYRVEAPGRFLPVEVKVSPFRFEAPHGQEGARFQVLKGLKAGERVVTSANFLIDSESRLRLGGGMINMPGMDMGHMKGMDHSPMKGMEGMDHSGAKKDKKETDHSKMKH